MIIIGDIMDLGQIIRNRRKEKDISQKELCKALGLYDSDISKIERGKDISLTLLAQIANVLELDMLDVLVDSGYISATSVKKHQIIPWDGLSLLTDADIAYINCFVNALIDKRGK
jgi:transcriptional regulator with XRE-family HTH domain